MGPIDALIHFVNFFMPALGVGLIGALASKLLWRRELAGVRLARLFGWGAGAGMLALLAGLVVFGHDGKMATYGAMVLACAVALSWAGWGPGRR